MKKFAVFDMDGLLFDTERLYQSGWAAMAGEFGQELQPDFPGAVCGTSGESMFAVIRKYYPNVDPQAFEAGCVRWVQAYLETHGTPLRPGAREILEYFQANGVRMALASGSHADIVEKNLQRSGFKDFFDAVISGDEVSRGKPEPDIFLLAAQRIGARPEDCYVFEDGVNGARAGTAAGCATIMIPDLVPPTPDLRDECAGIYPSLTEAQKAIESALL